MTGIVAVDIGGTHARFALATVEGGRVVAMAPPVTLKTAEHASFQTAWEAFGAMQAGPLPRLASIAVACPTQGEVLKLTNNPWVIRPALIPEKLHLDRFTLVNDFEAIAHAVAQAPADAFGPLAGPDAPLPARGTITILGPGTGLGVASLLRQEGRYHVLPSEGGHVDFAPLDTIEDAILAHLRRAFRRVSVERLLSGPGLENIYTALAALEGRAVPSRDNRALWTAAMDGSDSLAAAALDRFMLTLGSVAGDLALAHGAAGVVVAGGLGQRLAGRLPGSGFAERFAAKGRFESRMAQIPVRTIMLAEPGLYGAAAAFAVEAV
ncbi:glucokinase [Sandaracinobacteroides saxicola]|uniref:Glucokinase n=1 Tax=Sandaracinobacteroides saxicola TaxID=2759707 RepID=A0A7G5IFP7_9SPHN|nr:glucokinase [Sandaracinobacteroides saxicola]QMW22189.1 glucokinase [Sandaracinobacteroides saxicola]